MSDYIIAVDGGGTKCNVVLFDQSGRELAQSVTGPANVFSDFDLAIHSIETGVGNVLQATGLTPEQCILSAACAGAGMPEALHKFKSWKHPFQHASIITDIHASLIGANKGRDCALLIVGTGSCFASLKNSRVTTYGGHGFLLGDIASGAWIGKCLISWYLQTLDCIYHEPKLEQAIAQRFGSTASVIIQHFSRANPQEYATLAPLVFEHQHSSEVAKTILAEGVGYLSMLLKKADVSNDFCFIDGGLSERYIPLLEKQLGHKLLKPAASAEMGAFLYAKSIK
ncbi:hypothetical protein KJ365_15235 [Glaciecola sp. XM2]|jgi:glucosamine kinase|uniref:BadF/BadG/BcrA/BcrD ATPase family protein n=1 Tax=Glaciecola sp. XM2 TaxID=1914931 RepID=UPI001BDE13E9|nr:BadF/BadG/BcrA/BcrD ATPase family protein [Glaciecola sp. XM2]MBT1452239.1 hypothetical protein [Glaciecola sp. XM2]